MSGLVYQGLCEELGAENVVDWPWKPQFHGQVYIGPAPCLPDGVFGRSDPFPWQIPQPTRAWSDQEVVSRLAEFDIVVLASPRAYNSKKLHEFISGVSRGALKRLVITDGEDYTAIRWDLIELFDPSVYFKVSMVANPLQVHVGGAPGLQPTRPDTRARVRIVPFAMASGLPEAPEKEKDVDVSLLGGNNFFGVRREGVAEDRPHQKATYEARLRAAFPDQRLVTGQLPFDEYVDVIRRSRIAIALGGHGIEPVRTYEILSCPGTMLARWETGHIAPAPLRHAVHCANFHSIEEMIELVRLYLTHEEERLKVARAGNALLQEHYTPRARARHLISEALK